MATRPDFRTKDPTAAEMARLIDHTNLAPTATKTDIRTLCREALEHKFATVCVLPTRVSLAASLVQHTSTTVCTVVGFPLGGNDAFVKREEARRALNAGADEIDMVINIGAAFDGNWILIRDEVSLVADVVHHAGKVLKVIIESSMLETDDRITHVCEAAIRGGTDFLKTSTGFGGTAATVRHVELMYAIAQTNPREDGTIVEIKASGGVRDWDGAVSMTRVGARRIGTSKGVAIVTGRPPQTGDPAAY